MELRFDSIKVAIDDFSSLSLDALSLRVFSFARQLHQVHSNLTSKTQNDMNNRCFPTIPILVLIFMACFASSSLAGLSTVATKSLRSTKLEKFTNLDPGKFYAVVCDGYYYRGGNNNASFWSDGGHSWEQVGQVAQKVSSSNGVLVSGATLGHGFNQWHQYSTGFFRCSKEGTISVRLSVQPKGECNIKVTLIALDAGDNPGNYEWKAGSGWYRR